MLIQGFQEVKLLSEETKIEEIPESLKELSDLEKEAYALIRKRGEMMTTDFPMKMMGAIPRLERMGLVEVYRRRPNREASHKRKFVKFKESTERP